MTRLLRSLESHPRRVLAVVGLVVTFYLFWNTGIHSDDYNVIRVARERGLSEFLDPSPELLRMKIFGLASYVLLWWAYLLPTEHWLWVFDVVKWIVHVTSVWLVYRFAGDYLPRDRALLAALLFIFNPIHETTAYWYMTLPYVLTPALIMYAHHLIRHDARVTGLAVGGLGAFMSYSSPPYTFGLSVIFFLERSYRKAVLFLLPGLLYVAYYFSVAALSPSMERRLDHGLTLRTLAKNYTFQVLTFLDSAVGPSFLFKIWWAIGSLGTVSLLLTLTVTAAMMVSLRPGGGRVAPRIFWGPGAVLLLSLGMFSLTGAYSQMAFNLGNRVTVYGCLLTAFIVASVPLGRTLLVLVVALILVAPALGLSDHWKSWNARQTTIIRAIRSNADLARLTKDDILLVSGNTFSRLGPFSHIEFFSMPWVVRAIFKDTVRSREIMALPSYVFFDGTRLVDPKFGGGIEIPRSVYLYESDEDRLIRVLPQELPDILARRPPEIRHWVQLIGNESIHSAILGLSPRLGYLFK